VIVSYVEDKLKSYNTGSKITTNRQCPYSTYYLTNANQIITNLWIQGILNFYIAYVPWQWPGHRWTHRSYECVEMWYPS